MNVSRASKASTRPALTICPSTPKPKAKACPAELEPRTPTTSSPTCVITSSPASSGPQSALQQPACSPQLRSSEVQPPSLRQLCAAARRCATFVEVGPAGSRGDLVYADFSYLDLSEGSKAEYWVHVWDVRTTDNAVFHVDAKRRNEFAACVMGNYLVSLGQRSAEEFAVLPELRGASYACLAPERLG